MILTIGPWILLAIGAFALVIGALTHYRGKASKQPWIWVFGLAAAGVGVYGPLFLEPLGQFINPILTMQESPSTETYAKVFEQIGRGELPARYQELALAYALDRPVPNMQEALEHAVRSASNEDGQEALRNARQDYDARMALARREVTALIPPGAPIDASTLGRLHELPSDEKVLAARELLTRDNLRLDPHAKRELEHLAKPREPRVPSRRARRP